MELRTRPLLTRNGESLAILQYVIPRESEREKRERKRRERKRGALGNSATPLVHRIDPFLSSPLFLSCSFKVHFRQLISGCVNVRTDLPFSGKGVSSFDFRIEDDKIGWVVIGIAGRRSPLLSSSSSSPSSLILKYHRPHQIERGFGWKIRQFPRLFLKGRRLRRYIFPLSFSSARSHQRTQLLRRFWDHWSLQKFRASTSAKLSALNTTRPT